MKKEEYIQMSKLESSHWYFKGKQFIISQFLKKIIQNKRNVRILDIGCGTGNISQMLSQFGEVYGIDNSPIAIELCQQKGLTNLYLNDKNKKFPFKDNYFDIVCCFDLLEHLDNELEILKEVLRVIKPEGFLFITTPAFMFLWSEHDLALHHKRRYTKTNLYQLLESNKLKVQRITYYNFFLFPIAFIYRLYTRIFLRKKMDNPKSEFFVKIPISLNNLLKGILVLEGILLRFINFPWGVSLLCIAKSNSK